MRVVLLGLLLLVSTGWLNAGEQDNQLQYIAGFNVAAGTSQTLEIPVPAGESDPATFIPLTVITGAKPGPTVLMVAGVHGYEFAPILAAKALAREIQPASLSGTLMIVRLAHVAAYEARSPFVNPFDRLNLNRAFPGRADGSQTQRLAHVLSTQIIPHADIVFDVHSGDGAEWLAPFAGVYGGPLASDYPLALTVAEAFGLPNIVRYKMNTQQQIDQGRSLNRQAVAQGLPTVLIEVGENGKREPAHVQAIVNGFHNVLAAMGMLAKQPTALAAPPRYFESTRSVKVKYSGIWNPVSTEPRMVAAGDVLGHVYSYSGELKETIVAPFAGYTLYGQAGPPIIAGNTAVTIAMPVERLED